MLCVKIKEILRLKYACGLSERQTRRRRMVERLSAPEIEGLLEAAYRLNQKRPVYGLLLKTLFYTGTRVSEFVHLRVEDISLDGQAPQVYIHTVKYTELAAHRFRDFWDD